MNDKIYENSRSQYNHFTASFRFYYLLYVATMRYHLHSIGYKFHHGSISTIVMLSFCPHMTFIFTLLFLPHPSVIQNGS